VIDYNPKIIAIDFDGTIVEHAYPKIGKEMMFAFATIKALEEKGHRLLLWTYREGSLLDEAVHYCEENGVVFYAVNESYPGERNEAESPRKLNADIFIDDRNVGGFPGWAAIWQMLHPEGGKFFHKLTNSEAHQNYPKSLKNWFGLASKNY